VEIRLRGGHYNFVSLPFGAKEYFICHEDDDEGVPNTVIGAQVKACLYMHDLRLLISNYLEGLKNDDPPQDWSEELPKAGEELEDDTMPDNLDDDVSSVMFEERKEPEIVIDFKFPHSYERLYDSYLGSKWVWVKSQQYSLFSSTKKRRKRRMQKLRLRKPQLSPDLIHHTENKM
jgi:hypothetical protein